MRIAVLSGKGGTGKTTVAASLALSVPDCRYADCDAEEPNGALFLRPQFSWSEPVNEPVPRVDAERCVGCGLCARLCRFHALAVAGGKVLTFPNICHHCGLCALGCPHEAITEEPRTIGVIEGDREGRCFQGKLHIGEPSAAPVIRALKRRIPDGGPVVLDCPPGTSCAVVQSVEGCHRCLLVTEPTPFGLHDLKMAAEVVRSMGIPLGVVINKVRAGGGETAAYCAREGIPVLMEIPFSRTLAEGYSRGVLPAQADAAWRERFAALYEALTEEVVP